MYGMISSEKVFLRFFFSLTMLPQVLHHPPQHQRHTIFHQAPLLQLKQGHSKQLGVFNCPGSQHGDLNHLLHVLFNQHRCLVVLQGEQISGVSHWHYGHRGQHWSQHQVRHLLARLLHRLQGVWWRYLCGVHPCTLPAIAQSYTERTACAESWEGWLCDVLLRQISGYYATPLVKGIAGVTHTCTNNIQPHLYLQVGWKPWYRYIELGILI